jgi:DNA-binding transcriptional MerR regulator
MSVSVGKMRIGEVHALLRQDFPDIELSKIRYYEDKGLVAPARSRKGYRLYSDRDVECLREAIRLAQEEFVPLRVVRLRLVEQGLLDESPSTPVTRHVARGATANVVSVMAPTTVSTSSDGSRAPLSIVTTAENGALLANGDGAPSSSEYLTTQEFFNATELDAQMVNQLMALGMLVPSSVAGETVFTNFDLRVAQCAGALLARGVDARLLGSLRRIVEREVGVIDDITGPLRALGARVPFDQAQRVAASVASEVEALRTVLLEKVLQEYLNQ